VERKKTRRKNRKKEGKKTMQLKIATDESVVIT
jgi:hypothetical protein